MNKIFQNKKFLVGAGAFLVIVLILSVIGYLTVFSNNSSNDSSSDEEEQILTLPAEDIGLSLELAEDGREVIMIVEKIEDITAIEYELSYTSEGDIPRGAIGSVEVTGESIRKNITLGTCSDTCHYDEGVENIKIILKVTKEDGNVYQVEKSLEE